MKKLAIFLVTILVAYSIYYDLKTGTLPVNNVVAAIEVSSTEKGQQSSEGKFIEVVIKPGDTVLSLIEQHLQGSLPVSIETVIKDFQKLNEETVP